MKKLFVGAVLALLAVSHAQAATAFLVRQYIGKSVTGLGVLVCVYQYAGKQFERAQQMGSFCAPSVEIQ